MNGPALPKEEFNRLVEALAQRVSPAQLEAYVTGCGRLLDAITIPVVNPVLTQRVVVSAVDGEWLHELLDQVLTDPQSGPTLAAICRQVRTVWDNARRAVAVFKPKGTPRAALVLFNRAPFVDRRAERGLVDDVVSLNGRRVLVVRGADGVGKSHLELFARHLVGFAEGRSMATLRLESMGGTVLDDKGAALVGAHDLMAALVSRMGLPPDPKWDTLAQEQRQAGKLVDWLIGQTQPFGVKGQQWLIVIDSVNHPRVGPGAVELVEQLIVAAARGELINTGLIVLGMPKEVPSVVANDVEDLTLLPIAPDEVEPYLVDLASALGRSPDATALDAMCAFVLDGLVFPLDRPGMDLLRSRLARLHDEILRAAA